MNNTEPTGAKPRFEADKRLGRVALALGRADDLLQPAERDFIEILKKKSE